MKTERFQFRVEAVVSFTPEEIDYLMHLSSIHYDGYCQQVGRHKGFLYGIKNQTLLNENPTTDLVECVLDFRKIDTLCKLLEIQTYLPYKMSLLRHDIGRLLEETRNKSEKINS